MPKHCGTARKSIIGPLIKFTLGQISVCSCNGVEIAGVPTFVIIMNGKGIPQAQARA